MQKLLIVLGLLILLAGLFWPQLSEGLSKLPLGRLPGDIVIDKPGMKVYIPITTMVIISVIVSIIFWMFRK